jgi:hypothetical protein
MLPYFWKNFNSYLRFALEILTGHIHFVSPPVILHAQPHSLLEEITHL